MVPFHTFPFRSRWLLRLSTDYGRPFLKGTAPCLFSLLAHAPAQGVLDQLLKFRVLPIRPAHVLA